MWEEIMKEVDKDHDNSISPTEFFDAMSQVLKQRHATVLDNRA